MAARSKRRRKVTIWLDKKVHVELKKESAERHLAMGDILEEAYENRVLGVNSRPSDSNTEAAVDG